MDEGSWLETETGKQLISDTVANIIRHYRIGEDDARKVVVNGFSKNAALGRVVEREEKPDKVKRTRAFKDTVADIRKKLYYDLRRYSSDTSSQDELIEKLLELEPGSREQSNALAIELARSHASTRERLDDIEAFNEHLLGVIGQPKNILDIGCGMQPLLFPFNKMSADLASYCAVDKDPKAIAAINAYARASGENRLRALRWQIEEGWEPVSDLCGCDRFDVAFLFKLVPVVARQQSALLDILRDVPARTLVLTGSKQALTQKRKIEGRERSVLKEFYLPMKREVIAEFEIGEEFAIVLGDE